MDTLRTVLWWWAFLDLACFAAFLECAHSAPVIEDHP